MGGRLALLVALCASAGCVSSGLYDEPELFVGPGEVAFVDYVVNGAIGCEGGTVFVDDDGTVNGAIDAVDCKVTILRANNGSVTVTGGELLHIETTTTINGPLEAIGVDEVVVIDSGFNGDAYIDDSYEVTVLGSSMNGDLIIKNALRCEQADNRARTILTPQSCIGPL